MSLLAPLPPVIHMALPEAPHAPEHGKILVVHSKDVSPEELRLFKSWGRILVWDARYINLALDKLPDHDYLFVDMREKDARYALGSVSVSGYRTIAYVPWYHKSESFIHQLASMALTKFPLRAVSKEDFDRQLTCEKIHSPSIARSFLALFLPCLSA